MTKDERWLLEEKYAGVQSADFEKDKARLAAGEPLAYVIGWTPFLNLKIFLDSHPLIPRPETEWWTEHLLQGTTGRAQIRFLDLCAGSGAIGCVALKTLPQAEVYFGEIEPSHEATIRKNVSKNGLDITRAHIGIGNLFEPFQDHVFDVIAANPPYIPRGRALPESVAAWEPGEALFAGDDGLSIIRRIADTLPRHLAQGGVAWIECDSTHAQDAATLFSRAGFATSVMNDQYETPRVVVVTWQ